MVEKHKFLNYRVARTGSTELECLREEYVGLIQENALLRVELTRLRNAPRRLARSQQTIDNVTNLKIKAEKMCEALKGELKEAVSLAESRAALAAREGGGGNEVTNVSEF